jgi:hypothetical protein
MSCLFEKWRHVNFLTKIKKSTKNPKKLCGSFTWQLSHNPSAQAQRLQGQSMPSHCTQTEAWLVQRVQVQLLQVPGAQVQAVLWQCGQIT